MGLIYCKAGAETTFGTVAGTFTPIHVTDVTVKDDRGVIYDEITDQYLPQVAIGGGVKVDTTIEAAWRPEMFAPLLAALWGTAASPYTLGYPTPVSLQIGEKIGSVTRARNILGNGVTSATFTFAAKEFVKVSFDLIGQQGLDVTYDGSVTYTTENPLVFWGCTLVLGVTPVVAKEATLKIDRSLDAEQFVLGSFLRYRLAQTAVTDISGTITLTEVDIADVQQAQYGAAAATQIPTATNALGNGNLVFTCLKTDGSAGSVITIPVVYESFDFKGSKVSEIGKTINWHAVGGAPSMVVS